MVVLCWWSIAWCFSLLSHPRSLSVGSFLAELFSLGAAVPNGDDGRDSGGQAGSWRLCAAHHFESRALNWSPLSSSKQQPTSLSALSHLPCRLMSWPKTRPSWAAGSAASGAWCGVCALTALPVSFALQRRPTNKTGPLWSRYRTRGRHQAHRTARGSTQKTK